MSLWLVEVLLELGSEVTEHGGYSRGSPKFILHGCCSWQTCSGVVPTAGLAGGPAVLLDVMLTMGVEGMEA